MISVYIIYPIATFWRPLNQTELDVFEYMYTVVLFFISYRGLAYFRAFKPTRYLVKMITECFDDMYSFMILLVYSGFSFMFLFCALGDHPVDLLMSFKVSFMISIGDFLIDDFNFLQYVIFVIATLMVLIIMMNILISIVGDTFDRVQMEATYKDAEAVLDLVLEVENVRFFNRTISDLRYIHACFEFKEEDAETGWEGRMRTV